MYNWIGMILFELHRRLAASGVKLLTRSSLAAAVLLLAAGVLPGQAVAESAADVLGTGFGSYLTCVGCAAGAGLIVAGGPGAILAALYYPGGLVVAAGCIAACTDALS